VTPFPPGTILFAKIGEAIQQNYRVITTQPCLADNNAMGLTPDIARVDGGYLYHFISQVDFYQLAEKTAVPSLLKSRLSQISVPLPSFADHRRIAEVLDRAEALRAERRAALALLDTLTQSIFLDLFGDAGANTKHWSLSTLGKVVEGHGNPAEIGRCARWDGSVDPCIHQNHLIRVRVDARLMSPVYVVEYLNSEGGRRHLLRAGKSTSGLNTINVSEVRSTPIAIPPLQLQNDFARRIAAVDNLKTTHRASLAQLDALFASLQYRAFRGEL
jgi:type I restriction enzyme S subunit